MLELPYDPAIPFLAIHPKNKKKKLIGKEICTPMFTAALFTIAKIMKGTKCPSIEGQMKTWCVYVYTHNQLV